MRALGLGRDSPMCVRVVPGGVELGPRRFQEVRGSLELQNSGLRAPGESWTRYYEKGGPGA